MPDALDEHARAAIDAIHVPAYAANHALRVELGKTLLTTPHGVPNTANKGTMQAANHALQTTLALPDTERVISVVLSGDNVKEDGTLLPYTEKEAFALGQCVG